MEAIYVYWGMDSDFEEAVSHLEKYNFLVDILNHLGKTDLNLPGVTKPEEEPLKIDDLVIHTDDYGGIREWALLGFSNNILENLKVQIKRLWMCNPPKKIYEDVCKNYDNKIIHTHNSKYQEISIPTLQKMADGFNEAVIGQPHVMKQALASIYAITNSKRHRPVTLLFLGDSGIGKTETAKYISTTIGDEMVRIQFSMQQTVNAHQYIFGADHGEDSLARELIRRRSNVVLLDEFDKVPSSFYNAFYQMFDEGTFVDANYSVDVSKCIIICTTNYRSAEEAEKNLGTPIYSRFSKVILFKPISVDDKLKIAERCYVDLVNELEKEDKELIVGNNVLPFFEESIRTGAYPNMRMLRNDIEDAINYEVLKARNII